jgi:hypothetical protein
MLKTHNISFICLQDPPLFAGKPLRAPGFECIAPNTEGDKIRVVTYINSNLVSFISYISLDPDPNILKLKIKRRDGHDIVERFEEFFLINAYNRVVNGFHILSPVRLFPYYEAPSILVGDLNIHNLYTDPERDISSQERRTGEHYFRVASLHGYAILNEPGIYTRFPDITGHRPSTIDYTLADRHCQKFVKSWKTNLPSTGSDHIAIKTEIQTTPWGNPKPSPNWGKIAWRNEEGKPNEDIKEDLMALISEKETPNSPKFRKTADWEGMEAEDNFEYNLNLLIHTIKKHAPMKRPSRWSKAWWTTDLTDL